MGSKIGTMKAAASRLGINPAEYLEKVAKGLKWCAGCKGWHGVAVFGRDKSRPDGLAALCGVARKRIYLKAYESHPADHPKKRSPRSVGGETCWQCADCGKWKIEGEFNRNAAAFNGLATICKKCRRGRQSEHRARHPKRVARQKRAYHLRNRERINAASRAAARARGPAYRRKNRAQAARWERRYRESNREKLRAKYAVNRAVRAGSLVRPDVCEMCETECKPLGHHDSYDRDRWLVVTWFCDRCHVWTHHRRREQAK